MKWSEYLLWINLDLTLNELFILRWFRLLIAYNNTMESLMKEARTKTKATETKQTNVRMTNSPKTKTLARKWAKKSGSINHCRQSLASTTDSFVSAQKCQKVKLFIHRLYFKMKFAVHLSFFSQRKISKSSKTKDQINELETELNFYLKSDAGADAFVISSWSFDCSISNCLPFVHTKYIYYHCTQIRHTA